jgi:nucleoside-diphosphate-sugar epimerase
MRQAQHSPTRISTVGSLPETVGSEEALDELLSQPGSALIDDIRQLQSPLVVLGAAGKMGPTLCALARRAAEAAEHKLEIIAVSRFSNRQSQQWFKQQGIRTISCDLLEPDNVRTLPDSPNVVYLVGLKFGTQQNPSLTWAANTLAPTYATERYHNSRIVALSTGNVYPFVPTDGPGADEGQALAPIGEYGLAALARERLFEYHSRRLGTRVVLLRLNYAIELRYGVLRDIAERIWSNEPIDLSVGHLNCIWQGDANSLILRSFALASSPPAVLNLTGPGMLSVRELALEFAQLMNRSARLTGCESETALLSNSAKLCQELGTPQTPLALVMKWIADWLKSEGASLGKPTHYEIRSGQF